MPCSVNPVATHSRFNSGIDDNITEEVTAFGSAYTISIVVGIVKFLMLLVVQARDRVILTAAVEFLEHEIFEMLRAHARRTRRKSSKKGKPISSIITQWRLIPKFHVLVPTFDAIGLSMHFDSAHCSCCANTKN